MMLIKRKRGWELPERAAAPESLFRDRRRLVKSLAAGAALLGAGPFAAALAPRAWAGEEAAPDPSASLYPVPRNPRYEVERELTDEALATTYNNYYEFGSYKKIHEDAQALPLRPWEIAIDGLVERPFTIGIDELIAKMPLEERVYRHRCVEAW